MGFSSYGGDRVGFSVVSVEFVYLSVAHMFLFLGFLRMVLLGLGFGCSLCVSVCVWFFFFYWF